MKHILRILRRWPLMIAVALLLVVIGYEAGIKGPVHVYVGEHYYGWIRIEYDVKGAPKLSLNRLYPILNLAGSVPDSGVLKTSSKPNRDFIQLDVYYGTPMEVRPVPDDLIHARVASQHITKPDGSHFASEFEIMFIGPEGVYRNHRAELDRYRKGENDFVIPSLEALPKVRNVKR